LYNYPELDNFILFPQQIWSSRGRLLGVGWILLVVGFNARGQSLRKLEQRAINRTHLTFVNGDTVQRFTVTYAQPTPRAGRFYYWQGPTQILRTAGAYNGHLLTGGYQLTSRNGNLLGSGNFEKGLKTGEWRTWRPNGTPVSRSSWRRGRQLGKTKYYDEAGQRLRPTTPKPTVAVATTPTTPRFWQPAYWQAVVKRVKQRRADKAPAEPGTPKPGKKGKMQKPAGQPGEVAPGKKVKLRKAKAQPPVLAVPSPLQGPKS
jgi:hypothetical protein